MIERFIIHPFENAEVDKLPRPWRQYKNCEMPPRAPRQLNCHDTGT
jgi:hypothetical protein